jgi:hypothetical protein
LVPNHCRYHMDDHLYLFLHPLFASQHQRNKLRKQK